MQNFKKKGDPPVIFSWNPWPPLGILAKYTGTPSPGFSTHVHLISEIIVCIEISLFIPMFILYSLLLLVFLSICFSIHLYFYPSVLLSICSSVCLSVCPCLYMSICLSFSPIIRCTVVRNPWVVGWGGPWGFGKIFLSCVLGVVRKPKGFPFSCFLHLKNPCDNSSDLIPLPLPRCIYVTLLFSIISFCLFACLFL